MSKLVDLEKLSALETEIELLEKRKLSWQSELENLTKECNTLKDKTNKEIAQAKQQNNNECQEKINEANKLLKEAEKKLKTVEQREKDTEVINQLSENLKTKTKAIAEAEKEAEKAISLVFEREKKAELLIEQYEKKLAELEELRNKK